MPKQYKPARKLDFNESQNVSMAEPKTARAGTGKAIFWAFVAVLLLAGAAWWLLQSSEDRNAIRSEAAEKINGALLDTPFAGIGNVLLETPPPPPESVISPPTDPGTFAGRQVQGTISSPADLPGGESAASSSSGAEAALAGMEQGGSADNQQLEDRQVTPGYLGDLANWLAARYQPATGRLGVTAQTLNQYGGITLASKAKGGRSGLLRYAFQPSMLQGLYKIYIGRFMDDLNEAAQKRGMSAEQNRQFHMALAGKAVLWAAGLEGVLKLPDLKQSLQKIDDLAQKAVDVNMQLTNAVFELDELREARASRQQINTVQMRVDGLAARYRRATEEHGAAQRNLVEQIRRQSGQTLDADTLLFMAAWAERRLAEDADGGAALSSCVSLLRDLGRRCAQKGSNG